MAVLRNSRVDQFLSRLEGLQPIEIDARIFYRDAAAAGYTEYKTGVLFGSDNGARFSPPKEFPVLYFSADPLACALEVAHHARLLTPVQNVAELVIQVHNEISDIESVQNALRSEDEDTQEATLKEIAGKYGFLQQSYEQDPQLLKLYLLAPIPLPHETIPVTPIGGTRINVPIILSAKILSLLDEQVLITLGATNDELTVSTQVWKEAQLSGNWTCGQDLGRAAFLDERFDGILFPSSLPADEKSSLVRTPLNLVLFMDEDDRTGPRGKSAAYTVTDNFINVCDLVFGSDIGTLMAELDDLRKKLLDK